MTVHSQEVARKGLSSFGKRTRDELSQQNEDEGDSELLSENVNLRVHFISNSNFTNIFLKYKTMKDLVFSHIINKYYFEYKYFPYKHKSILQYPTSIIHTKYPVCLVSKNNSLLLL